MHKTEICRHCRHASYAHVNGECVAHDHQGTCGCVKFEAYERRVRQRTWIVGVAMFIHNRWESAVEVRVQASTSGGAALKAVRQVKAGRASRRRISQTRINVQSV